MQNNFSIKLNDDFKTNEKNFKQNREKLEKLKMRFHSLGKIADEYKSKLDQAKESVVMSNVDKKKLSVKFEGALNEFKEAEVNYTHQLSYTNNLRVNYIEITKNILKEFQILEENHIGMIKDSLRKYHYYEIALTTNEQIDSEQKTKIIEAIECKLDIEEFIKKTETPYSFPEIFQYESYKGNINSDKNESINLSDESIEKEIKGQIKKTVSNAIEGKLIDDKQKDQFSNFMKEKKFRKYFFNCLNAFRSKGKIELMENAFYFTGLLFTVVVEYLADYRDYENIKYFLILCQTFYKIGTNKKKIYIQKTIDDHQIWKDLEFWEELLKFSINQEMKNQSISIIKETFSNEKIIVFNQLSVFAYQILSFQILKENAKNLINKYSQQYSLSEEDWNKLDNIIENFLTIKSIVEKKESSSSDEENGVNLNKIESDR